MCHTGGCADCWCCSQLRHAHEPVSPASTLGMTIRLLGSTLQRSTHQPATHQVLSTIVPGDARCTLDLPQLENMASVSSASVAATAPDNPEAARLWLTHTVVRLGSKQAGQVADAQARQCTNTLLLSALFADLPPHWQGHSWRGRWAHRHCRCTRCRLPPQTAPLRAEGTKPFWEREGHERCPGAELELGRFRHAQKRPRQPGSVPPLHPSCFAGHCGV